MELGGIKIDTTFKYQIVLQISDKLFYSDKYFDDKDSANEYMSSLSKHKKLNWRSIPVLCPRQKINISDLITKEYQIKHPIENGTFKEQIKKEFEK